MLMGNIQILDIQIPHEIVQYWGWFLAFNRIGGVWASPLWCAPSPPPSCRCCSSAGFWCCRRASKSRKRSWWGQAAYRIKH